MEDEKLESEKYRIRRAIVEETRPLSARDTAKVLVYARKLRKAMGKGKCWPLN